MTVTSRCCFETRVSYIQFLRSAIGTPPARSLHASAATQQSQVFQKTLGPFNSPSPNAPRPRSEQNEKPAWLIHKEAVKAKLGGAAWNPRKRLSPDTVEGIKQLHKAQPEIYTTPVLASHFKVTPDAVRRILRSKWQASDAEAEERLQRWDKRGQKVWSNLVELGIKPPKKWREMGVGKAEKGEKPKWKTTHRNTVNVDDGFEEERKLEEEAESIIPIVGLPEEKKPSRASKASLLGRLGV